MGKFITIKAKDGHELGAYRADPSGTPKGGLVIIQEIFGIDPHIQETADHYAKQGYVAIAPALFDRIEKGLILGYDPDSFAKARVARGKLTWDGILADCDAARLAVKSAGKVGIVGYCFGGSVAWRAATNLPFDAASSYYGGEVHAFKDEKPKCPVEFHFGEIDQAIPLDKVEEIRKAHPGAQFHIHKGAGHAFTNNHRAAGYNAEATKSAEAQSAAFFEKHLAAAAGKAAR